MSNFFSRHLLSPILATDPDTQRALCRSLNSVLDLTNGILYIAIAVVDPSKPETIVVTVLQDAAGRHPCTATPGRS